MEIWAELVRFLAGSYFVWCGCRKFVDPAALWRNIMAYRLLPSRLSAVAAALLPALEFLAGLLFVAGVVPIVSGLVLGVLIAAYTVALVWALFYRLRHDSGCLGLWVSKPLLVHNIVLFAAVLFAAFFSAGTHYPAPLAICLLALLLVVLGGIRRHRILRAHLVSSPTSQTEIVPGNS